LHKYKVFVMKTGLNELPISFYRLNVWLWILIVSTTHVFPPSVVESPESVASFSARVFPKVESAESRMTVVSRYSTGGKK
jgi:hypothetical protein